MLPLEPRPFLGMLSDLQRKYFDHARNDREGMIQDVYYKRTLNLPVCIKCERICMYDRRPGDPPPTFSKNPLTGLMEKSKPYVTCPHCGYHGPASGVPFRVHIKEVDPNAGKDHIRVYT